MFSFGELSADISSSLWLWWAFSSCDEETSFCCESGQFGRDPYSYCGSVFNTTFSTFIRLVPLCVSVVVMNPVVVVSPLQLWWVTSQRHHCYFRLWWASVVMVSPVWLWWVTAQCHHRCFCAVMSSVVVVNPLQLSRGSIVLVSPFLGVANKCICREFPFSCNESWSSFDVSINDAIRCIFKLRWVDTVVVSQFGCSESSVFVVSP